MSAKTIRGLLIGVALAVSVAVFAQSVNYFPPPDWTWSYNGGTVVGSASGGLKGAGTINAQGLYIGGVAVVANGGNQSANTVYAGPTSGSSAAPTWRMLVAADIPAISLTSGVSGVLPVANGGNGTSSPTLTAGSNVTITGTWPNYTIAAAGGTGCSTGNPTATVGLTAVNGSAVTCMRTDGAPALSQAISPTWTGQHIFAYTGGFPIVANTTSSNNAGIQLNNSAAGGAELTACGTSNSSGARCWVERVGSTGTYTFATASDAGVIENTAFQLQRDTSGNFTGAIIPAPASGVALTITGASGSTTLVVNGASGTGILTLNGGNAAGSFTRYQTSGTNIGFIGDAFAVFGSNAGDFGIGGGGAAIHIGPGSEALNIGTGGNVTISAPSSGAALVVSGLSTNDTLSLASTGATNNLNQCWACGISGSAWNIWTSGTDPLVIGSQGAASFTLATDDANRIVIGSSGNVTVNAPASGIALTVNGLSGHYAEAIQSGSTTGQAYGLTINAGTNSSDAAFAVANASGATQYFAIFGDGGLEVGAPTGGDPGLGKINVSGGYYVNNVLVGGVPTYGSFTTNASTCTITDSNNVSGCTRTGTGTYTITFTSSVHECVFNTTQASGSASIATAYMPGSVGTSGTLNTFTSTGSTNTAADLTSGGIHFVCQ